MEAIAFHRSARGESRCGYHHPDLKNPHNRVRMALHTWAENGITGKNVISQAGALGEGYRVGSLAS